MKDLILEIIITSMLAVAMIISVSAFSNYTHANVRAAVNSIIMNQAYAGVK